MYKLVNTWKIHELNGLYYFLKQRIYTYLTFAEEGNFEEVAESLTGSS